MKNYQEFKSKLIEATVTSQIQSKMKELGIEPKELMVRNEYLNLDIDKHEYYSTPEQKKIVDGLFTFVKKIAKKYKVDTQEINGNNIQLYMEPK